MLLARENGILKVYADTYSLEFAKDRPFVFLDDENGVRLADLFVLSSVHPMHDRDDTTSTGAWRADESFDEIVFTLEVSSSTWEKKTYRFYCQPRRFSYDVEVSGSGQIAEALYFGGYYTGQLRWGSGFFWSGQRFKQCFNPEPSSDEIYTFPAEAISTINMTGVPLPGKSDWFFTPPPYCFAAQTTLGWMSMGIEALPGENRFTEYGYHGSRSAFYLSMPYEGHTTVNGRYRLPAIAFDFGHDPYTLLATHIQHLRSEGKAFFTPNPVRPSWWFEPIFCGWGSQCYLASVSGRRASDYASQASYEAFLHTLELQGILPGTIVLDDKWQACYGENDVDPQKWPDLTGFIRSRHEKGQRVLLWLKAWDPEGVPIEECITNAAGLPLSVDPTNPAYVRRLRESVSRMLSSEGYDADGFKIDFSARIPSGPGIHTYGDCWGLELMRLYLSIIHDEAKRIKPDAMIITHTPHPYLADLIDVIRLNDINIAAEVCPQMTHRARVAEIACPEALIDMDNWPIRNKAAWREYLKMQPGLGIPALYFASHIDSTHEPLQEDDYALVREVWTKYRAAIADHHRQPAGEKISELGGSYLPETNRLFKRLAPTKTLPVATKPLKAWDNEVLNGIS